MTHSHPNHDCSLAAGPRPVSVAPADYPIRHTRDWRGREWFVVSAGDKLYQYESIELALHARDQLRRALPGRQKQSTKRATSWRRVVQNLLVSSVVALLLLTVLFQLYPPLLLNAVDLSRSIFGPAAVAHVETTAFNLISLFRQARVSMGDTVPRWQLEESAKRVARRTLPTARIELSTPLPDESVPVQIALATLQPSATAPATATIPPATATTPQAIATPFPAQDAAATLGIAASATLESRSVPSPVWIAVPPTEIPSPTNPPTPARVLGSQPIPAASGGQGNWPPAPLPALIGDGQLLDEGQWRLQAALGDGGQPAMAVTQLRPDPTRPDIQVALVAIDLSRTQLRLVAGTEEPPGPSGVTRTGVIPPEVQASDTLLAAFNGGFKAVHGNDGMFADNSLYLPPQPGRATLAVMADGGVRIGLWGRDLDENSGLRAWRQNGLLLVDNGAVTEEARAGGLGWGATLELKTETWRSGVGVTPDGRTLFYAVGDGLTAPRLADVLRAAGASMAMQLDINNYWVRFVTFERGDNGQAIAQQLISAMPAEPRKYLVPDQRDFCYLVARR